MSVITNVDPSKIYKNQPEIAPKDAVLSGVGDLSDFHIGPAKVLIGIYKRPEKTSGGIFLTDAHKEEEKYQGRAGLVLKIGAGAYEDDGSISFYGFKPKEGDWVLYNPNEGRRVQVNGYECRLFEDRYLCNAIIPSPDSVY